MTSSHTKEEAYSADFGDFASFLFHMRQQASLRRQDLLVVDSGDLHHGTGLTDITELDGQLSNPIFEKINYDALSIGNHELVQNSVIDDTFKNFAPRWGKRYLTSNTFIKDGVTNERIPVGNLYNKFRLKYGTRVMSYGFMFNFNKTASRAFVEPSTVTVTLPWFQKTLKEDVDMYLIVGHVPIRWPEATAVVQAIRAKHPSKPIVFMGGHAHVRDFVQYDARAVGMASGRFLETIGWLSVDGIHDRACRAETSCVGKNLTVSRRYLANNVHTFKTHSLTHPAQKFDTWKGRQITKEISALRQSLNLTDTIGCAPRHYYLSQYPATDPRSVLHLATTEVLPFAVVQRSRPRPSVVFIHTLSHRFDIFKGPFTIDDTFVVSPYDYRFVYASVPFKIAKQVLPNLNGVIAPAPNVPSPPVRSDDVVYTPGYVTKDDYGYGGDDWPHTPVPHVKAPTYVSTALPKDLDDHDLVDVIWLDFFSDAMEALLGRLDPATEYKGASYRKDVDINTMYRVFAQSKWGRGSCRDALTSRRRPSI
ncbi:hypothetical protein BGZ70_001803 [Mortierella alpina]|uniref:Calcineurin-like phosphoesterase domain-containing protein n=1 Tax=Mortierella alpina TaxID=64518 RepID=A0A9P6IVV3_MORAP|nr:hypothetical protein BGZ70_001803 [Mortierella alpina]